MAKYFTITIPDGASNLKLDNQGRGSVQYTVKNVSATPVDGKAVLVAPGAPPANDPVQKKWVTLEGAGERHFDVGKEQVFTVKVMVPPKTQAGDYTFRMDVASAAVPDVGDQGPAIKFSITQTAKPPSKFPWWILIVVLVVLLIGGGVAAWLLIGHKPTPAPTPGAAMATVPNLVGMTTTQANQALVAANLSLDPNIETVQSAPENSDKIIKQTPDQGASVQPGSTVHVTQGAEIVAVPMLIGHPFTEAQKLLAQANLALGTTTTGNNSGFAGGVVFDQQPAAATSVLSKSAVNISVTPQTTTVPKVVGMTLVAAKNTLESANLALGSISGDMLEQPITSQAPAENLTVQVGTKVNVSVPIHMVQIPPPPPVGQNPRPKSPNGYAVDHCLHWATSCGQPAADQYCRSIGYPGATGFTSMNMRPTWVLGDNKVCDLPACVGFTSVSCGGNPGPRLYNGYSVDNCLNWAANCGKPAADRYCQLNGHPNGAQSFGTIAMRPTWVVGDGKVCNQPGCVGFSAIQCR